MPEIEIPDGETRTIVSRSTSQAVKEREYVGVMIEINQGSVRLIDGDSEEEARHGFPLALGDVLTIDPNDRRWLAYADGSTAVVNAIGLKFAPIDLERG